MKPDDVANRKHTNGALAAELERLGVPFVAVAVDERHSLPLTPVELMEGLAASDDPRLRLGLIPLFLARPDFSRWVDDAACGLSGSAWATLACYYTAAALLQRQHAARLAQLGLNPSTLPDKFGRILGLSATDDLETRLSQLALKQAKLTNRDLNWRGTYDHAVKRLLRRVEWEAAWANS